MSKAKKTGLRNSYTEPKSNLIDLIRGETLQRVALYLKNRSISFGYLIDYLKKPDHYPGNANGLKLIFEKMLNDIISERYFEIQKENLQIKYVYDRIFNQIFRGKN